MGIPFSARSARYIIGIWIYHLNSIQIIESCELFSALPSSLHLPSHPSIDTCVSLPTHPFLGSPSLISFPFTVPTTNFDAGDTRSHLKMTQREERDIFVRDRGS